MTADRHFDRQLRTWFDERATSRAPEGLLERSLERVDATPQRPSWRIAGGWRPRQAMRRPANGRASLGRMLAVVAVVAIAAGAGLFLRLSPAETGGPSGSPSVAASPSTSIAPTSSAVPSVTLSVQPRAASWTATGSMGTARVEHTAAVLPDGRVLVAGGITGLTGGTALASAELYDPANGTWAATGAMTAARAGSTATLLPNGKVLVAGGYCCTAAGSGALATAELYDPTSRTWTATGSMTAPRTGHTATLLPDGKVLVAGGGARGHKGPSWASAELYDPATGTWAATGSMGAPRTWHSAALQPDGKVLVQGGVDSVSAGSHTLTTAERYDPSSGSWSSAAGSPVAPREGESVALLGDGRTLMLCACTSGTASLYDPSSGSWAGAGSLITPRWSSTATLLPNDTVLVAGGTNDVSALAAAELFDPGSPGVSVSPGTAPSPSAVPNSSVVPARAPSWTVTGSMGTPRYGHTATLVLDGKVLVAGGYNGNNPLASAELYDPGTGSWSATGSMRAPRGGHTATLLLNGKVLVAGCSVGNDAPSAELYDPASGSWTTTGGMVVPRCLDFTATLLPDGKVLVAGGLSTGGNGHILTSAELYDPASGSWTATGSMGTPRYDHTATLLRDGKVLVTGGADHGGAGCCYLTSAELFDPASDSWTNTGSMGTPHGGHTATLLRDGRVLVSGNVAELYDPASGSWSVTGNSVTRYGFGPAVLLPDGRVLVVGAQCGGTADCAPPADFESAELYDPGSGSWTVAARSPVTPRNGHTLTLLADGRVLVAGGFSNRLAPVADSLASAELYDPGSGR